MNESVSGVRDNSSPFADMSATVETASPLDDLFMVQDSDGSRDAASGMMMSERQSATRDRYGIRPAVPVKGTWLDAYQYDEPYRRQAEPAESRQFNPDDNGLYRHLIS